MTDDAVVVIGGDATGLALAARLALAGRRVVLYETPPRVAKIAPMRESRQIRVQSRGGTEVATLAMVTDDPFAALAAGDVLLASVPPHAQASFGELLLPLIEPRHMLVLVRGGLGTLALARWLLQRGRRIESLPTFVETDLEPFVCRITDPDAVCVYGSASRTGFGVFPGSRTAEAHAVLASVLPGAVALPHVAAAGLGSVCALLRSVSLLMSVSRIERACGGFLLYDEGLTPGVASVVEAIDLERRALSSALGYEQPPIARMLSAAGYGPEGGDLWTTVHGSHAFSRVTAPEALPTPWLSSRIPFVLRAWAELGERLDIPVPTLRAVIRLADAVGGVDSWSNGRSLEDLGVGEMTAAAIARYLLAGSVD